ncbi:flippase activity-associated protein Agl23 [Halopelagius longus]|uniref:TIGR03663 family protein n=1 Tax=Halopelagius longus TaxID=1236180 RepID=A0A1H1ATA8_9EURY|nr:flippase activity-associated protein Agl23 [Halopelagius longus]RDI70492.1 TIGR03663 family protein [Halopelagius longus]SDQ42406.1 TIGR03663 family protein [Halopelagius longus]
MSRNTDEGDSSGHRATSGVAPGGGETAASERRPGHRRSSLVYAVAVLAAAALLARLVGLGARPFHWDEARVGYWTLRYLESGAFEYRPVAGGPLLYLVDRHVFALLGASDATARLPVAVLGGLLPLCALLFRDRLDDVETFVFAAILAFNPLLVYYSRFLRGDVPLAFFALASVGFAVRAYDRRSRRDAYAAAAMVPLAAASSGFAAGYVLCWVAAGVLLVDQPSAVVDRGASAKATVADVYARVAGRWNVAARAFLLSLGVTVYCFAPRAGPTVEAGLWKPTTWHLVLWEATGGALWTFVGVRVVHRYPDGVHAILPFVSDTLDTLARTSLPILLAAVAAFLWTRYARGDRRPLVAGFAYWGAAAAFVFPVVTEVSAPWVAVHVLLPLSLPGAVGIAALLTRALAAARATNADGAPFGGGLASADAATVAAVVLVVVAVVAQAGAVTAAGVYGPSDRNNHLAQYGQPSDDVEPLVANVSGFADGDRSTPEVLYVGSDYATGWDPGNEFPPVVDSWGNRLPLPWYFERAGLDEASTENVTTFDERADRGEPIPPVVVTTPALREQVEERLGDDYEARSYRLGLWGRDVVVFVAQSE